MTSDFQELLNKLSPEKRALFQRRLQEQHASGIELGSIARRQNSGPCELSFAQELMWLLAQLVDPGAYHVPRAMRIQGPLNVEALHYALNQVVARHEILRTTYRIVNGRPMQFISPSSSVDIARFNLSNFPPRNRQLEADRILIEEGRRPFDLSRDVLLRAVLIEMAPQDCLLLLVTHHIASDGESRDVFFREIQVFYTAFIESKRPHLPELPIQYADYAAWQRNLLTGEFLEQLLSYWKKHLAGAPRLLTFPSDRPRPAVQSFEGAAHTISFPAGLLSALKKLSREEGATLFMTGLAAVSTLLFRYSGQSDIVIGTPVSGRNRTEVEPLIGYFSNSVALRINHSSNPTFRQLIKQAREVALGAFSHQELPFERLVVELQPQRDLSYSPIYQVMISVGEQWRKALDLPALRVSMLPVDLGTAKFDLNLGMGMKEAQVWGGMLTYCTALFDPSTIMRMFGHLQNLLEGIVENPDQRIQSLPMLSETERRRMVSEWNSTAVKFPVGKTIHELVEEQVERIPDSIAVSFGQDVLSYRELDARANQLAHYLRSRSVGPEFSVGIYLNRSLLLPVALLAVLKAGGVCVPLDPAYPSERVAQMMDDLHGPLVLTQSGLSANLQGTGAKLVLLSDDWSGVAAENRSRPTNQIAAQDLAYIIFTSGSTGRPRGVKLTHAGL
ncbi:MAG: non-ribosomal peptide synthetase, partial [Deltaproteobacteria bacterium]